MARSKRTPAQVKEAERLKKVRAGLAKLKSAGLFSGDVKNAKGGWRQNKLLKTYDDVVRGIAKTVSVGKSGVKLDPVFRVKAGRAVVKADKGERVRFDAKKTRFVSTYEEYGVKRTRVITNTHVKSPQDLPVNSDPKKKFLYLLPHNHLREYDDILEILNKYKEEKKFEGLIATLEVFEVPERDFPSAQAS